MFYNIKNVILTRKPLFKSQILFVCSHCSPLRTDQSNIFLTYKRYKNKSQAVQRDVNDVTGHFNLMLATNVGNKIAIKKIAVTNIDVTL